MRPTLMPNIQRRTCVILTDNRGGLGAARSLSRRGVPVIAVVWDETNLLLASKVPKQKFVIQGGSDRSKESNLYQLLMNLEEEKPALITSSDRMISFIAHHRQALSKKFSFNIPDTALIEALNDKKRETTLIEEIGIPLPKTIQSLPGTPEELEHLLRFPILFKPASYEAKTLFPAKNKLIVSRLQLREFYATNAEALPVLLAQEVIPGPDEYSWVASCTFNSSHDMLDCGVKQKIRMNPAHFGGSSFAISATNSDITALTRNLGKAIRYVGHAGVEFRWDERDHQYKYIECNPRMPENVEFDEYCGLPTVWNSYLVALNEEPEVQHQKQRDGVIFIDLRMDLAARLKDGESILAILATYLKYLFHRRKGQSFAFDDPMPGIIVALRILKSVKRRALAKLSRSIDQ